jgi:SAM-dependent methyltransferase
MISDETLAALSPTEAARQLEVLAALQRWRAIPAGGPHERAKTAIDARISVGVGALALEAMAREVAARHGSGDDLAREASERAVALRELLLADDEYIARALANESEATIAIIESLRDGGALADRVTRMFPELAPLARADESRVSLDYEARDSKGALLDHLSLRTLGRKLVGLERNDRTRFQATEGLTVEGFERLHRRASRAYDAGLGPLVRLSLLFRDVAKVSLDRAGRLAHNEAAASMLLSRSRDAHSGIARLARSMERTPAGIAEVALFVSAHGLVGQHLRGECPLVALTRFAIGARRLARVLDLGRSDSAEAVMDAFGTLDACDVASVREGLFDDALAARFARIEGLICELVASRDTALDRPEAMAEALANAEKRELPSPTTRSLLRERLGRLRANRIAAHPSAAEDLDQAIARLSDREAAALHEAMGTCQLWYAEHATGELAADATLRLLALCLAASQRAGVRDGRRMFHADLWPLARYLQSLGAAKTYALRLLEAVLAPLSVAEALALDGPLPEDARRLLGELDQGSTLGTLGVAAAGDRALALEWRASREADALLTLLGIYEAKSSAAFHGTLKALCDLYGLRKDDFDRVSAEANYLDTMNSARSDKARLCDYVVPGTILEVGPGGGVVLDLLAERNPGSRIIGLDVSKAVVEALGSRKAREARPWEVVEGDAFHLSKLYGDGTLDTVVFCSILHEIYSYVPWDNGDGRGMGKFRMGSVEAIVASAFRALKKGGRIVVRDGVMPPSGTNVIEFVAADADETFALYAREFEGRKIAFERAGAHAVRLSARDAHAFLFTYVWGPASFPYEIREQYGVETYERYADIMTAACESTGTGSARRVAIAADVRSYLQPGYTQHLRDRVRLYEADGATPARLFDSNALWVIEKQ